MSDEQELIERMRRGEQRAFDQFFEAYAARLGSFAARRSSLDAAAIEDVVQNTMINAMRSLATFRGGSSLFTWLCQICRNQLADLRRKAARQPAVHSLEQVTEEKATATIIQLTDFRDPLDECATDADRAAVRRAINRLPAHYARILELRYGDELTVPEIGRVLQISESAAESQLVRARQAFRAEWQRDGNAPRPATPGGEAG
ncbi:MAG TPA: RNA polymerase sigma factor [Steroidobacteraceae bacterium]|nr:RNA polymerase sigma factor [Steroidobacteraceae bacterium]